MKRVNRKNPCPVCGKHDWCGVSEDGSTAFCMRVSSGIAAKNGAWIHRVRECRGLPPPRGSPASGNKGLFDAWRYHARIRRAWDGVWLDGTAVSLGVNMDALDRLQPGWDAFAKAVGFPMRDASGAVTGIRLRNFTGDKWAVSGSRDGLFYDPSLTVDDARELVVCEGPTDTAAAYTLGLCAAGRSNCMTGAEMLGALCGRLGVRLVTIVADADALKRRPDGTTWRPGIDGALALGSRLGRIFRVVVPPKKDLREWVGCGCTRRQWEDWASNAERRLPA